jgi:predicted AlkP superfamily phosphohydrolase/phosphomutase
MATSQDPGSLGVYGNRNRADHSYGNLAVVRSRSITELAIWDQLARAGKRSIIVGVPPGYPPRRINGLSVSCFQTPDTSENVFTHPAELSAEIRRLGGDYPVDVKGFRTHDKGWLRDRIFAMSQTQFQVVRHLMRNRPWDYIEFVDIGLDRIHHGFWKYHDPYHVLHEPDSPYRETVHDYYRHLDLEIGRVLELLTDETIVLVVSDHGAQRLDGALSTSADYPGGRLVALAIPLFTSVRTIPGRTIAITPSSERLSSPVPTVL